MNNMSKIEKVQRRIKIITGIAMLMLLVGILALLSTVTELTYMGISGVRFLLIFVMGVALIYGGVRIISSLDEIIEEKDFLKQLYK